MLHVFRLSEQPLQHGAGQLFDAEHVLAGQPLQGRLHGVIDESYHDPAVSFTHSTLPFHSTGGQPPQGVYWTGRRLARPPRVATQGNSFSISEPVAPLTFRANRLS